MRRAVTENGFPPSEVPPARGGRPPDEVRSLVTLLLVIVGAILALGAGGILYQARLNALAAATTSTEGVAHLLDEHLTRTLTSTDILLRRMAEIVVARRQGHLSPAEADRALGELQAGLPERGGILVLDETGRLVTALIDRNTPVHVDESVVYKGWFDAHTEGVERKIGPMRQSRISDRLIFTVSRRILDPEGRFIGAIGCGIHLPSFTSFHDTLMLGRQGVVIAAVGSDILLRQPAPETALGLSLANTPVLAAATRAPAGTLTSQLHPAGRERLVSFRRLAAFPEVVVIAGMTLDEVLAPWWRSVWQTLAALLLASGAVGGVAFLAFRGITREQAILDRLEEMVRDRTRESESRAREARLANESKTRFLAAASHDLRQPLQAAGMFVEVLAASSAGPRQAEVITKLRRSIESTNSLLSTLLDVSSLEAGRVTPTITPFRLMPLLAGLVDQLEPEATQRGLSIGAVPTDARVLSDPVLLERLVRNLVVNAVRHTDSGGVLIGCRRRGEKSLAIEVWDTGIGIPADKLDAVFDDFIRLDDTSPRGSERGLGLGLGVVRRMAQLLGHTVYVRSRPGKGSCFGVVVPRG